ncbi:16S rRNA (guanine(527)-N(7))-methyltransferase RsmG [Pacificimonas flava]|uniref:Ribosomal RNA small subunit methyltransferase G n=2 Tax=Pacificimonas TaxID=1960290 RepID=A0A219B300_9SPHN|nr:16S rRNA (guanine(527)-N(7))-methyltransferase RsmG [Pacificimonas flava]
MNLVAPSTLDEAWDRHIEDSLQLLDYLPAANPRRWVDMGSGAGFPGLVAAYCLPGTKVHLIESRQKKCRFLETVAEALAIKDRVTVHAERIESLRGPKADIISARACAALTKLFDWGLRFQAKDTLWILPKGRSAEEEIETAREGFDFDLAAQPSRTDPDARILLVRGVRRKRS